MSLPTALARFARTSLAALSLAAGAGAAQAGTLSMSGWEFSGNRVNVTSQSPAKTYSGLAGGFKATLSGLSNPLFNNGALELYCVDLMQSIGFSRYTAQLPTDAGTANFTIRPITDPNLGNLGFNPDRVLRLTRLINYAESAPTAVDTAAESTSLQLAIWNTLYDTDASLAGGSFKDSSTYASYATQLLTQSATFAPNDRRQLYVLQSSRFQDQLFWVVPEPASLALVALGFAAVGAARRRRT